MRRAVEGCLLAVFFLTAGPPDGLTAQQDTAAAASDTAQRMKPLAAFWRSLVIPGWGQAATGRHVTGAAFVAWEGVTMMMTLKAQGEANFLKETGSPALSHKRQEVQDWLILWIFNHLFAAAEALVSAHLQDFPRDLEVRAFPGGVGVSVPVPRP